MLYKTSRPLRRTLPDWAAVQRAEDTGTTLIKVWRDYAASAAQPYALSAFRKEFRKWQSSSAWDISAEYRASERFWQGKAHPRPDILTLGDGASLRIRGGHLEAYCATQHFRQNGGSVEKSKMRFAPGPHHQRPKTIIFAGWGGLLSIKAVHFCIDHRIAILATGWLGDLTTFVAPRPIQDAALVRLQCGARPAPIAREIVLQKFCHYVATARMTRTQFRDFKTRLVNARTLQAILTLEAVGSSLAWLPWSGLQLPPRTGRNPPLWFSKPFSHRSSGIGQSGARHATDPINAMLNLAYAREAGRLGAMLAASGACLAIGYLHFDKPHRHSLIYDALEPLRPLIDARVRAFIESNTFDRGDFFRLSTGHVRMVPSLIKIVLEQTALPENDITLASAFMLRLLHSSSRPAPSNMAKK
jgi:CRISPR/Cas system-associated endonuclease Cas1